MGESRLVWMEELALMIDEAGQERLDGRMG